MPLYLSLSFHQSAPAYAQQTHESNLWFELGIKWNIIMDLFGTLLFCVCHAHAEDTSTNLKGMLSMRIQIYAVCWVYVYKFTAYAEDTLTNSGFFGLSKAYAEHTHTNLRRMLSIRVQIQGLCWGYAYKYNAYTERAHTNLCRMLSMRLQNQNVCWVYACNVEWQKDYLDDVLGPVRSTLIYFIAEGGVDQQAGGFEASSKVP